MNTFIGKKKGPQIITAIAVAGWGSMQLTGVWLPLSIQAGMLTSLYLLIGYIVRIRAIDFLHLRPVIKTVMGIAAGVGIQQFAGFWLVHDYMGNGWLDFFISICASYIIILYSSHIERISKITKRVLKFYGRNSLQILCLHIIELLTLPISKYVSSLAAQVSSGNNTYALFLATFAVKVIYVTVGVMVINLVKEKTKLLA